MYKNMCVHGYRENRQNGLYPTVQKKRKLVQTHEKVRNEKRVLILENSRVMIKKTCTGTQRVDLKIKG